MSKLKSLFHVSLHVRDGKRSIEFYEKLGLTQIFELNEGKEGDEPWVVYMRVTHGQYVELQPIHAKIPDGIPPVLEHEVQYHTDQTVWHFALETDDLADMIRRLISRGIQVWTGPDKTKPVYSIEDSIVGGDGCKIAWVIDPDGTPIELMEQDDGTLQRKYDKE